MLPARDFPGQTRHAIRFAAWARAWRGGFVSYDEVQPAVTDGEEHLVADLPGREAEVHFGEALATLSRLRPDELRLVLPVPGDPRGLPGPGAFTGAALGAGEGVVAGPLGFVPAVREHVSGSGDTWRTVCWRVFDVGAFPGEYIAPGEAELDLARELAEAAESLIKLDVARWQPELAGALAALRRPASGGHALPVGFDPRSRRLYARAAMLEGVLALADRSAPGGAVNAYEANRRAEVLRPLRTACRRALMAAVNAPLG